MRSVGIEVTRRPHEEVVPAAAPAAAAVVSDDDEGLDSLAAARTTPEVDPRVAWREAAIRKLVDGGAMPERLARVTVNQGKRSEVEALLSRLDPVPSDVPPQGQAPRAPLRPTASADPDPVIAPSAAPVNGQRELGSSDEPSVIARLEQQVAVLQAQVYGDARTQSRNAFAKAQAELSEVFPRIRSDSGQLDPRVADVARSLMRTDAYAHADERTVLHAAAAAVFSTGPGSSGIPATQTPRTPTVTSTPEQVLPMTPVQVIAETLRVRSQYGSATHLSPQKNEEANAEIARRMSRRR